MRLESALAAVALAAVVMALPGCGATVRSTASRFVTSGDCAHEQALVRRALDRSHLRADVNGDGRPDTVAAASDPGAAKPCRAFVGVRVQGGATYSTHLFPLAVPVQGLRARVIGLPHLDSRPGVQVVVDTTAAVDAVLAQMFTLAGGALRTVQVPGSHDGTFIVGGGGVVYPRAAACTSDGRMVMSMAAQTRDGKRYRVTRRTYEVRGTRLAFVDPQVERATVPVDRLVVRFPEFGMSKHWTACSTPVSG